jgi:hypothetical protein
MENEEFLNDPAMIPIVESTTPPTSKSKAARTNSIVETVTKDFIEKFGAIDLKESLARKAPLYTYRLLDGNDIQIRVGAHAEICNIACREGEYIASTKLPAIIPDSCWFRIASLASAPLDPVGYSFVIHEEEEGIPVCRVQYVYVSGQHRDLHLGTILSMITILDIIEDERVRAMRFEVVNRKFDNLLKNLGFAPFQKTEQGNDYRVVLDNRHEVGRIFGDHLQKYLRPTV